MHGTKASRGLVVAAALMFSAFGSSLAMADPEPTPAAPTAETPSPTSEAPAPTTETATPVAPTGAPVPAVASGGSLCAVIRGNKTQIDDVTWPLKVATKAEGWDWSDGDAAEARRRIDGQLPTLLANLQQGLSSHGSGDTADALRDAIAAGKDLITTVDQNGDGGDTSGALGAFDKGLDEALRTCVGQ